MNSLSWEQHMVAIQALAEAVLVMNRPGEWMLRQRAVAKTNGRISARGKVPAFSPLGAVERYWEWLTRNDGTWVVIDESDPRHRRAVHWDDLLGWQQITEPQVLVVPETRRAS